MKKIIAIASIILVTGCYNDPQSTTREGTFKVEFLFEKDSIKVYRFIDGGHMHYFTTRGETMRTQTEGKYNIEENISNY